MVREELEKLTGLSQEEGEELDAYKISLVQEADAIIGDDDAMWNALSKDTQVWMNQTITEYQAGKTTGLPDFPINSSVTEPKKKKEVKEPEPEIVDDDAVVEAMENELTEGEDLPEFNPDKEPENSNDVVIPKPKKTFSKKPFPKKPLPVKAEKPKPKTKAEKPKAEPKPDFRKEVKLLKDMPEKQTSAVKYIWEIVCRNPDITYPELQQALNDKGIFATPSTIKTKRNDARVIIKILISIGRYRYSSDEREVIKEQLKKEKENA